MPHDRGRRRRVVDGGLGHRAYQSPEYGAAKAGLILVLRPNEPPHLLPADP
jgi:hypothetical protein